MAVQALHYTNDRRRRNLDACKDFALQADQTLYRMHANPETCSHPFTLQGIVQQEILTADLDILTADLDILTTDLNRPLKLHWNAM